MTRSRTALLVGVLFGLLSTNITFTIFNVALVDISRALHTTSSVLTWAITGPLLVVGVSAPVLGRLGDLRGHRGLYLWGLTGALACALLTVVAWDAPALIAARLLSGVGSSCLTASSWAILFRAFPPEDRTRVLGWWSLVSAGGPVIGVAIGGPVVQALGWRWIFVGQIPLIVAALVVNVRLLPRSRDAAGLLPTGVEPGRAPSVGGGLDIPGAVLLAVGVGSVLLAINQVNRGWTSPLVLASLGSAVAALAGFAVFEKRADSPIFPLEWLSDRGFVLPCVAAFAMNFAYMGGFFLTPLFLEQGLRYSIGAAGFFQIARPLVFAVAAPAAGYLAVWSGERAAAVAGGLVLVMSMLAFAILGMGSSAIVIVVALGASGLAMGIASPSVSALVAGAADVERMGSASAGMQVASQIGVVAGIQAMESVQVARQHAAGVVSSYHDAYLAGGAVAALSVVAAFFIRSVGRPRRLRPGRLDLSTETMLGPEAAVELG